MSKKTKKLKAETLVAHLEPLSDISAIDIGVRKKQNVGTSYIVGRFVSATNKRLIMKPYEAAKDCGVYVELTGTDIETLEVRTIRTYTGFGFNVKGFSERERYDRLIIFMGGNVKIVGRFLKTLVKSMNDRKLRISTSSRLRPENMISTAISACAIIGESAKQNKRRVKKAVVVTKKKEFFFREKLSEVNDENGP